MAATLPAEGRQRGPGLRNLVGEIRTLLADQASQGQLSGLVLPPDWLGRRPSPAAPLPAVGGGAAAKATPAPLQTIRAELGDCQRCGLCRGRKNLVFGEGLASARLMFVGEGPGRDEDVSGRPFVGEAGRLLGRMLTAMGFRREQVYIANVVKCRPPNNRQPEAEEVGQCAPFLWQQLEAVAPAVVVALGRVACQTLLGSNLPMGRLRGKFAPLARACPALATTVVMPTYHPAYLLRRPEDKILVWRDLQAVMARLAAEPAAKRGPSA